MKKIMIGLLMIMMLCMSAVPAFAVTSAPENDLSNYPEMFIEDGKFNGIIVVGDRADASDVIAATDIAASLAYSSSSSGSSTTVTRIEVGAVKLASEVADPKARNVISIGSPCANTVSAALMGNPAECLDPFPEDQGMIKLYNYNGYHQVVAAGPTALLTRMAARVLATHDDYNLEGDLLYVWGTSLYDIAVIHPGEEVPESACEDSDEYHTGEGKNYYVSGVTDIGPGQAGGEAPDYCHDSNTVVEYFCTPDGSNGGASSVFFTCPNGCREGRCYYPGYFMSADREEYFEGDVIELKITAADSGANVIESSKIHLYIVDPDDKKHLIEENLVIPRIKTVKIDTEEHDNIFDEAGVYLLLITDATEEENLANSRNSMYIEFSKAAVPDTPGCEDSDDGNDVYEAGEARSGSRGATDICISRSVLKEAVCKEGEVSQIDITCPSNAPYCNRGECSAAKPVCLDSDGGMKPGVSGTMTEARMQNGPKHTDYCERLDTKQPVEYCKGESWCGLREYYCSEPYYMSTSYKDVKCTGGCRDGVCLGYEVPEEPEEEEDMDYDVCGGKLLYFYTSTCPYCARQKPIIDQLEENFKGCMSVERQEVTLDPSNDYMRKYDFRGVPTMVFIKGSCTAKHSGYIEYDRLKEWLYGACEESEAEEVPPYDRYGIVGKIRSGETNVYSVAGKEYEIEASVGEGDTKVKFAVNGEATGALVSMEDNPYGGYYYKFSFGAKIAALAIDNGIVKFEFRVAGPEMVDEEEEAVYQEPEEVIEEPVSIIPVETPGECRGLGCSADHSCLSYGIRMMYKDNPSYCDIDGSFRVQKEDDKSCQNNYECLSNSCGNGKCIDFGARLESLEQEVKETKGIVSKILEWLGSLFG